MLREFSTTRPALQQMLEELLGKREKATTIETRKLQMETLTSKDKHTVKLGNHPHTNMISKPPIMRRGEYKASY